MESQTPIFARFGGIRPMARALGMNATTVQAWKRARRIPAQHHATILRRAEQLGIDVAAEDVIFPFPEDRVLA